MTKRKRTTVEQSHNEEGDQQNPPLSVVITFLDGHSRTFNVPSGVNVARIHGLIKRHEGLVGDLYPTPIAMDALEVPPSRLSSTERLTQDTSLVMIACDRKVVVLLQWFIFLQSTIEQL